MRGIFLLSAIVVTGVCTLFPAMASAALSVEAIPLLPQKLVPAQDAVPLLAVRAVNTGETPCTVTALTISYTGTAPSDILDDSVRLVVTGGTSMPGQEGGNASFGGKRARIGGLGIVVAGGGTVSFVVYADLAAKVTDGDLAAASLNAAADVELEEGSAAGSFPVASLETGHEIEVTATKIAVEPWTTELAAGKSAGIRVSCVDANGNIDRDWSGSTLTVGGAPGAAPGASPAGNAPAYGGSGAWSAAEHGQRLCSYTLYCAETGRMVRISDSALGTVTSDAITVSAGAATKAGFLPVGNQEAGVPFTVTIFTGDAYGNPGAGHAGGVTTLSCAGDAGSSPGGFAPQLPGEIRWDGSEENGRKTVQVTLFKRCAAARLQLHDSSFGEGLSGTFAVAAGAAKSLLLTGPDTARFKTETGFTLAAIDTWGNTADAWRGRVAVSCTDTQAGCPAWVDALGGTTSFTVLFRTRGMQTVSVTESAGGMQAARKVTVGGAQQPSRFVLQVPSTVAGGREFEATVRAVDETGAVITDYNRMVAIAVSSSCSVLPRSVTLRNGSWTGQLMLTGGVGQAVFSLSDGEVTTAAAAAVRVSVSGAVRARAYPTVFTPAAGAVRIRYFLSKNTGVTVHVYNMLMDEVRTMEFSSGRDGGREGLNVIEWDGRGGEGNDVGHSGGYHILIDKGYEKEWVGAVIKN